MKRDVELDEIEKLVTALEQLGDTLTKMYEGLADEFIKIGDRITAVLGSEDEDSKDEDATLAQPTTRPGPDV